MYRGIHMKKIDIPLNTYPYILEEIEHNRPNNHLLLGNGFNFSLGVMTKYDVIYSVMKENNQEYDDVIIDNFNIEQFIGTCKSFIVDKDNPYAKFMKKYYHNKIKIDFMKAVTQIVNREIKNIYQTKNEEIYLLLQQFDNYFTLNYDPFIYQLLMLYLKKDEKKSALVFKHSLPFIKEILDNRSKEVLEEIRKGYNSGKLTIIVDNQEKVLILNMLKKTDFKREMNLYFKERYDSTEINRAVDFFWEIKDSDTPKILRNINDGFSLFERELVYNNSEKQNVFFLHGGFHIYGKDKKIYKISQQAEKALYERIEEIVEDSNERIVCVFSDENKLSEIMEDSYLVNGFNKLKSLSGTLLIIGCSLARNDEHIFKQINQSNITRIYLSSSEKSKDVDYKRAIELFPKKDIYLFDWQTISFAK